MWPTTDCLHMTRHAMEHSALLLFCVFGGNFMSSPELKQVWGSLHGSCITKRTETWIWQSQSCSVVFLVTLSKKKNSANMVSGKSSLTDYFNSIQSPSCDSNVGQLVPLFQVSFELRRRAEFFFFFSWDQSCLCLVPAGMTDRDTYTTEFLYLMKDLQTVTHWGFVEYCGDVFYLQNMWYFIHITFMTRLRTKGCASDQSWDCVSTFIQV